jgi:hypothetical protein
MIRYKKFLIFRRKKSYSDFSKTLREFLMKNLSEKSSSLSIMHEDIIADLLLELISSRYLSVSWMI